MMAANKSDEQHAPARITRLSQEVINRIAAGEVIQRPSNALKELLENSLDAKATRIKLFLRDGGITELRIEDNGSGILKDDFPLLCERFATSKLEKFEDLYSVATYGFRGEALASISFCAQLSITSKTNNEACAYRAHFINGHMYDPDHPDADHTRITPSMVAGMPGTQIIVKKLFYNMSLRQKALKSRWGQEYNSCLRVVSCYAIHNFHCSFSVQKVSDTSANSLDLNYKSTPKKRAKDVIKSIYGGDIASYLIEIAKEHSKIKGLGIKGVISNCDFAMNVANNSKSRSKSKKRIFNTNHRMEFVLFINNRLVESNMIKKSIMSVYEDYLAKNHHPFVYLSISIPPNFVDVNVHPTKKEVKFLHRDEVLQLIQDAINEKLKVENESRTFHAHSLQHFMTQSNQNQMTLSGAISPKKRHTRDLKNGRNNVMQNRRMSSDRNTNKQNTLQLDVEEEREDRKPEPIVTHTKGLIVEETDEDSDDIVMDTKNEEHSDKEEHRNSISPHAPLRRRSKTLSIGNVSDEETTHDTTTNSIYSMPNITDDSEATQSMNDNTDSNRNNGRYNFRRRSTRVSARKSPIKRKRTYSDIISTEDDEDDVIPTNNGNSNNNTMNVNSLQPNIVTLNLNEKKKKPKARKATRVRVDSQQSSLDYYWKTAVHTNGNKRRKLNTSSKTNKNNNASNDHNHNKSNNKRNRNHNQSEQKMSEMDDHANTMNDEDTKPTFNRDPMAFLPKKQMQKKVIAPPDCVDDLMTMIDRNSDANLKKIFEENVFVGCIDSIDQTHKNSNKNNEENEHIKNTFQRVLFQYDTKLYLCNIHRISRVYFFEICIKNIGKFRSIYRFVPNPSAQPTDQDVGLPCIYQLILLALELPESDYDEAIAGPKKEVAESVTTTLCHPSIAKILKDYFSIEIDTEKRTIQAIPCLVDGYIPGLLFLPVFLFRLVAEIEWFKAGSEDGEEEQVNDEIDLSKQLFKQISMEIARFYQIRPPQFYLKLDEKKRHKFGGYLKTKDDLNNKHNLGWILQHVIFRSMNKKCTKYSFHPPKFLCNDGSIVQIACTQQLYKVFERC
eukprot:195861_1